MNKIKFYIISFLFALSTTVSAQFANNSITKSESPSSEKNFRGGNGLNRGFRAIMELGIDVKGNEYGETSPVLNVSMGAQINHYIFVGGGFGGRYYTDSKVWAVPIYANLRADVINSRINPFVDVKIGYTPIDLKGFFASAGIGCRFRCGDRFALGLSAGYEIQNAEYYHGYSSYSRENLGDVFVRLGFEW